MTLFSYYFIQVQQTIWNEMKGKEIIDQQQTGDCYKILREKCFF